ncbi:hypothetical protein SK069_10545 [Patulibacter brassicae]|uniref:Uncharacterized protein n=1 Tax=Patulibacter brassicae TaxID=1705717 RepID=A0ABU4VJP3_9ACTN|nr:hypothetical protein [Patulibacter brassicae]MDX8152033.1 hypothetical protein [Patulibacter brassicae]
MARLSPRQRAWRGRLETVLRVAAPALDLVVGSAERIDRAGRTAGRALSRQRASRSRVRPGGPA